MENDKYYFELYIKNNKINVIFDPNNNKNLISITLRNKKYVYQLENKSKDYHNNFVIKKNSSIIFRKNFPNKKSRIYASKILLKLFLTNNKDIDKFTNFEFGLMLQKEIIKLNVI